MEVDASKKPSGLDTMGDLFSSLPKTRPPKQGFLPRRDPSSRSTKGQRQTVPFEKTQYSVWEDEALKKRPSTKRPIKPTELKKMEEEVEKAIKGKSPEESKKILDMAKEIVEEEEDPLTKLLSELRLGGRTRRRKNKRNHKNKRKTKRSSY
jgi:hypothetical protein